MKRLLAGTAFLGAVGSLCFLVEQSPAWRMADASPSAPVSSQSGAASPVSALATLELEVRGSVMRENMMVPGYFDLPEFFAYSGQGEALLNHKGFSEEEFRASMNALLDAPEPVSGVPSLRALSRDLVYRDRRSFDAAAVAGFDLVLVEYWAAYCGPCKLQLNAVEAFRDAHPERRIALLKVNRDPTAIEGVTMQTPESEG